MRRRPPTRLQPTTRRGRARIVAGSVALYVVLGTLGLHPPVAVAALNLAPVAVRQEMKLKPHVRQANARRFLSHAAPESITQSDCPGGDRGAVLNNMNATSSGKQRALRLEMSRAALGNLLFRQITPN